MWLCLQCPGIPRHGWHPQGCISSGRKNLVMGSQQGLLGDGVRQDPSSDASACHSLLKLYSWHLTCHSKTMPVIAALCRVCAINGLS